MVLLLALMLSCLPPGPLAAQEPQGNDASESLDLTIDGSGARLGARLLRYPVREAELVDLLGPPERTRYRLRWPDRGVLAVPAPHEGEIEELVFVLCKGAPEAARAGVFPGTVRLDGKKLSCDASHEEALAALPEDFTQTDELDTLANARRGALELVVSVSSWSGLLSISLGFLDPDEVEPIEPEVRTGEGQPSR